MKVNCDHERTLKVAIIPLIQLIGVSDRIHNGLGSAVAEVLVETCPVPMRRVGVKERYGQVETQDFLQREYGLTAQAIVAAARELL